MMAMTNKYFKTIKQMFYNYHTNGFSSNLLANEIWIISLKGVFVSYGITSIPFSYIFFKQLSNKFFYFIYSKTDFINSTIGFFFFFFFENKKSFFWNFIPKCIFFFSKKHKKIILQNCSQKPFFITDFKNTFQTGPKDWNWYTMKV